MEFQQYLPFIQAELQQFYLFTLENPLYALSLAAVVWLLTAILYGIRISGLKRNIRQHVKVNEQIQADLAAIQAQFTQTQAELVEIQQQLQQETLRSTALQARVDEAGAQISAAISGLAAHPDLGQQGLSVSAGMSLEQLWQRFSIAVQQLSESLLSEKQQKAEWQAVSQAETAKLAEKDVQIQAVQLRFENQQQQIAQLQQELAQQQDGAVQRLAVIESKYQANLLRLAELEQQAATWRQTKPESAQPLAAVPATPVEIKLEPVVPEVEFTPEPIKQAIIGAVTQAESTAQPAEAAVEPEPVASGGRFKNLFSFSSARKKIEQLDEKLGQRAPQSQEISQASALYDAMRQPEPEPEPVLVATPEPIAPAAQQQTAEPVQVKPAAKPASGNKLAGFFSNARQKINKLDAMLGQPQDNEVTAVADEPEVETPVVAVAASVTENIEVTPKSAGGLGGKLKGMFAGKKVEAPAEPAPVVIEPIEIAPAPVEVASGNKLKGLLGKFKR